jgi:hypothetical protein
MLLAAVMIISCCRHLLTSPCKQPHNSSTKLSSFIGPHHNPECYAHSKVNRYYIGEDSSDCENKWTISDESLSSVVGSGSITPKPHSLKPSTKSSFKVSSQPSIQAGPE